TVRAVLGKIVPAASHPNSKSPAQKTPWHFPPARAILVPGRPWLDIWPPIDPRRCACGHRHTVFPAADEFPRTPEWLPAIGRPKRSLARGNGETVRPAGERRQILLPTHRRSDTNLPTSTCTGRQF